MPQCTSEDVNVYPEESGYLSTSAWQAPQAMLGTKGEIEYRRQQAACCLSRLLMSGSWLSTRSLFDQGRTLLHVAPSSAWNGARLTRRGFENVLLAPISTSSRISACHRQRLSYLALILPSAAKGYVGTRCTSGKSNKGRSSRYNVSSPRTCQRRTCLVCYFSQDMRSPSLHLTRRLYTSSQECNCRSYQEDGPCSQEPFRSLGRN